MRSVPAVLFQIFGASDRGRGRDRRGGAGLDHRVPVGMAVVAVAGGMTTAAAITSSNTTTATAAAVVVRVGYDDNGVGGTIGPVAVGPADQPQHDIVRVRWKRAEAVARGPSARNSERRTDGRATGRGWRRGDEPPFYEQPPRKTRAYVRERKTTTRKFERYTPASDPAVIRKYDCTSRARVS